MDDPITPGVFLGDLDQVEGGGVTRVLVLDVLECGFFPFDCQKSLARKIQRDLQVRRTINGGKVNAPDNNVLAVGVDTRRRNVNIEAADLVDKSGAVYGVLDPWD